MPRGPRIWTRCRLELDEFPPLLYRVHHPRARTRLDSSGFTASSPEPRLPSLGDTNVVTLLNNAFDRDFTGTSPFVQLYTDFHVANRFAHSLEEEHPGEVVEIWVIDGPKLASSDPPRAGVATVCFLASTLVRADVGIDRKSIGSRRGEVLVVAAWSGVKRECLLECIRADDPRRAKREGWAEEVELENDIEWAMVELSRD